MLDFLLSLRHSLRVHRIPPYARRVLILNARRVHVPTAQYSQVHAETDRPEEGGAFSRE